jgi:DNA-binding protein H-NS
MAAINVDKMSLKELVGLEGKVQSAIAEARARERSVVKKKMAELAETSGFSLSELFGGVLRTLGQVVDANPIGWSLG